MEFVQRLITLRKERGLTQQSLANAIDLHVNQIKRYEAGTAQPTLDTLVRLAKKLSQFDESEIMVAKELLEGLILKHNAKRAFANQIQEAK
ncbi:helix-turn-helix transcriptional regulator [Motilimonas sp. E26]|uniref:helix-turn-helix domain-containing protein n=1 Tax=Motilimonas TaxID=1914248 RepID=UPI001E4737D8|nr:helix-turn-helix transcriptional regulator [Motilimonas sp. E26]